jgi:hypothetical protein
VFWNADTHALRFYNDSKYRYMGQKRSPNDELVTQRILLDPIYTAMAFAGILAPCE